MKLFCLLLLVLPFSGIAQTDSQSNVLSQEDVTIFIANTNLILLQDNKQFLSSEQSVSSDYLNAQKLQNYSNQLLQSGNYSDALVCNNKARTIALTVLTALTSTDYASHYSHFNNEKADYLVIDNDTTSVDYWLQKAN